ncbi:Piwi domain-containing protein [Exophiala viscosa]|uniref:Piwi domain-containing protein n=1 Tax=Exophiala viscosa TaxID=2486360 RepID=A0AAN6E7B9_9EURO|nr:Piwi domain-containing protein [Exophiala viscosa]
MASDQEALRKFLKGVVVRTQHFTHNTQYDNFLATITDLPPLNGHQEPTVSTVDFRMPGEQSTGRVSAYFNARHQRHYQANSTVFAVIIGGSTTFPADLLTIIPGQVIRNIKELPKGGIRDPRNNKTAIATRGRSLFHGPAAQGGAPEFEFGVGVEMLSVPVCLIETPKVRYRPRNPGGATRPFGNTAEPGVVQMQRAKYGSWDLRDMSFFRPAGEFNWTIIEYTLQGQDQPQCSMNEFNRFRNSLGAEMRRLGMPQQFVPLKVHKHQLPSANLPKHHEVEGLKDQFGIVRSSLENLPNTVHLLVVLLPQKDMELYSAIKRIGDQRLGLPTVCHVLTPEDDELKANSSPGFPANLSMKINLKADAKSVNQALAQKPGMLGEGTMILGIDVTHAVSQQSWVASMLTSLSGLQVYKRTSSTQENELDTIDGKKKSNEQVVLLQKMVVERLEGYRAVNGKLPLRLVVYRDGLSEGQFEMCKIHEFPRIEAAVDEVFGRQESQSGKRIPIVLICAVKRHHTRLFAESGKEEKTDNIIGKGPDNRGRYNFNPMPGTMVKDVITYGEGQDFFLISQKALIGTAHPTHYVILHNTTGFSRDEIAQATHHLCFLFGRSSGTVSVCPAAYYADLAADRARCYVRKFYVSAARGTWDPNCDQNHELNLAIHPRLREKMFYI